MPNFLSCFRVKIMKSMNYMYLLVNFSIIYVENKWLFLDLIYETESRKLENSKGSRAFLTSYSSFIT